MHRSLLVTGAFALTLFSANTFARVINVPQDFQTIQAGIDASRSGDTVLVQPGVYDENLSIDEGITLASLILTTNDPAYIDSTVIDAGRRGCGIAISRGDEDTTSIRGFTVRNGLQDFGGGIDVQVVNSPTAIEDVVVTHCFANQMGGGLYGVNSANIILRRVCLVADSAAQGGGGASFNGSRVVYEDCVIRDNYSGGDGGGVLAAGGTRMVRTLIIGNASRDECGGLWNQGGTVTMNQVTIANNTCRNGDIGGGLYVRGYSSQSITNIIVYGNSNYQIHLHLPDPEDTVRMSYSNIEGGRDAILLDSSSVIFEELMDADPLFINPDAGDYRLAENSPCIDAGNPESEPDPDGTRADMGGLPYDEIRAWTYGRVFDLETNEPLRATVFYTQRGLTLSTDDSGVWRIPIRGHFDSAAVELTFRFAQYQSDTLDTIVHRGDSLRFDVGLRHGEFLASSDDFTIAMDSNSFISVPFSIQNSGNSPLHWAAKCRSAGEVGAEPFTVRQSIDVGRITGDDRVQGVVFDGENYYVSGANRQDSSQIYILNQEGELIGSFEQPCHSRYGMRDLAWDGELIWGAGDSVLYGIDREGTLRRTIETNLNPANNLAFDPVNSVLWTSGTTTNLMSYDRDGNLVDSLSRMHLLQYGIDWFSEDTDGYNLYISHFRDSQSPASLYKMSVVTGDTIKVVDLALTEGSTGVEGAFICNNFDRYWNTVFMFIQNIPGNRGGDVIQVLQLEPNDEWLTVDPPEGEVAAGESVELTLTVRTTAIDSSWAFASGDYDGEIVFTHDGVGGEAIIPVHLTVRLPNLINNTETPISKEFEFTRLYPTPFNSTLTVGYRLDQAGLMKLMLVDLTGREVRLLDEGFKPAGERRVTVDLPGFPSGVYYVTLKSGVVTRAVKIVCLK